MHGETKDSGFIERMVEKRNEGGFTLIELLIVIIILAILAAIVVFAVGTTSTNAVQASCQADAKSVETALESYKAQHSGTFPTPANNTDYSQLTGTDSHGGPWLRAAPGTSHYFIEFNSSGQVWVGPAGGTVAYSAGADFDKAANACSVAS